MAGNPTGSLRIAMDALCALEQTISAALPAEGTVAQQAARQLTFHRWRPQEMPDLPAVWNWMPESPNDKRSNAHMRDKVDLRVQIGVRHTNVDEQMAEIEIYADVGRQVFDQAFQTNCTLDGTVELAQRKSMRTALDRFNGIDVLCVEFALQLDLITPLY